MIDGAKTSGAVTRGLFLWLKGQSIADGQGLRQRLNGEYSYHGIAAAYPAARVAQTKYTNTPADTFIYNKAGTVDNNWGLDDGVWETYQAGTNSHNGDFSNEQNWFGHELSLAHRAGAHLSEEVFVIKSAFGGTGLISGGGGSLPGPWNNEARQIGADAYLKRSLRDLRVFRPGVRMRPPIVIWDHGQYEAGIGTTGAAYIAAFEDMYAYDTKVIESNFVLDRPPVWYLILSNFAGDANEDVINQAKIDIAALHTNVRVIDGTMYPRNAYLTTAEDDPIAKGSPNNSVGLPDNNHLSHIGHTAIGELIHLDLINIGYY